jgi:hypothetical protein
VAFVVIQLFMLALVIGLPQLTLGALGPKQKLDLENIRIDLPTDAPASPDASPFPGLLGGPQPGQGQEQPPAEDIGGQLMKRLGQ